MLVTIIDNRVHVTLSRRNLHQLETMLDSPSVGNSCLARKDASGVSLVVQVEDDLDHYEGRAPARRSPSRSPGSRDADSLVVLQMPRAHVAEGERQV